MERRECEAVFMVADPRHLHQIEIRLFQKRIFLFMPPSVCFTQLIQTFCLIGCFLGFVQFVIQMSQPVSGWHRIIEPEPEPEQHLNTD